MKTSALVGLVALAAVIIGIGLAIYYPSQKVLTMDTVATSSAPQIIPIMHATALIQWGETAIYTDPTDEKMLQNHPRADIVLVTDTHGDHFSTSTLESVVGSTTVLVVPQSVMNGLTPDLAARALVVANGESIQIRDFTITAVPMYNIPESDKAFHTKGRGNGYVIESAGERVYVAGDTSNTPEMRALTDIDIALVPMNLPYTMSVEEAAQAVLAFKPHHVYPYHYRGPDGLSDVNKFKELVNTGDSDIDVVLANWYPSGK